MFFAVHGSSCPHNRPVRGRNEMIRGAIEVANHSIVSGWLYSRHSSLNGELVHAFVGSHHVGSGRIGVFRRDIKDAGLGDGHSGFYFPITLLETEAPESIVVRLDECDMVLVQQAAAILPKIARAKIELVSRPTELKRG